MDTPKVTTVLNKTSCKHNVPHLTMSAYVQCHGWGSSSKATCKKYGLNLNSFDITNCMGRSRIMGTILNLPC